MIEAILGVIGIYFLLGVIFAVPFAWKGAKIVDPAAVEGTWGFKLLIIPGAAIFWPLLALRWMKKLAPPEECSAHRLAAEERKEN